jgi:predicted metal-dependent hydrolase
MEITFGKRTIYFNVERQANSIFRIAVAPDGEVSVAVPDGKTEAEIVQRVKRKAKWIVKQLQYFEQFQPLQPSRSFVNGETYSYLGKQYRLKIILTTEPQHVSLKSGFFCVSVADESNKKAIQKLLENWYRDKAKRYFKEHLEKCIAKTKTFHIAMPKLQIRSMRRRWGSCTRQGKIILNLELIKMPPQCIDYVITHELCHLIERNHTDTFYRILSLVIPEWKKVKERLERFPL